MNSYTEGTVSTIIPKEYVTDEDFKMLTGGAVELDSDIDEYTDLCHEETGNKESYYFYFDSDHRFDEDGAVIFQKILRKMPTNIPVIEVEFAHHASKFAPQNYGGGCCVISRDKIEWFNTSTFISDKIKEAKKRLKNSGINVDWETITSA